MLLHIIYIFVQSLDKLYGMKISLFCAILCILSTFFSCTGDHDDYGQLTEQECYSLLKTTALSSAERAKVVRQYATLYTHNYNFTSQPTSRHADTCLAMLQEVIPLAPANLKPELQITMLPFCLSKLVDYNQEERRRLRNMMSDIENSKLTPQQQAKYLIYKAQFYTILRAHEQAFDFCEQARDKFRQNNDIEGEFNSLTQMSMLYLLQKDYMNSLRYCDSAFYLKGYTPSLRSLQRLYSQYSQLYANMELYDKAIAAFRKSGRDSLSNSFLANLYVAGKRYQEAINIINRQKELFATNPNRLNYCLRLEAEIFEASGEYTKAFETRSKAIQLIEENSRQINKKNPDIPGIPTAFVGIYTAQAEYAWKNGKPKEAFDLLHKAEILTLRAGQPRQDNIRTMALLTEYYRQTGKFHLALISSQRRDSLQAILSAQKQPADYEKIIAQHELEMLDATINKQKAEKQATHFSRTFIGLGVIFLSVVIILITLYCRTLVRIRKLKKK